MAGKHSLSNDRRESSKTWLPCIGSEDRLLTARKTSRDSILKSPQRKVRENSDLNVANVEEVKIANGKYKKGNEGKRQDQQRVQINNRRVNKRGSNPVGFSKGKRPSFSDPKESGKDAPKTRRGSKKNLQVVKPPSPDVIDLSNEKVVQELLLRLYQTLKTPDEKARERADKEQGYWKLEKSRENGDGLVEQKDRKMKEYSKNEPNLRSKSDSRLKSYNRLHVNTFPQLNKSTSNLQLFYSKPVTWESLEMHSLQRRKRTANSFAIRDSSLKCNLPEGKEAIKRQVCHLTWPYTEYNRTESSRTVLCDRALSVPLQCFCIS